MASTSKVPSQCEDGVCRPIKDLESLLNWTKSDITWNEMVLDKSPRTEYVYDGSLDSLDKTRLVKSSTPKTLLCHDMKGGYLEDRFVRGTSDITDPYVFTQWSMVDTFVYFSHHFVTIPPLGWINAANVHGVQVLGTIITEWTDGEALWQKLFEDQEKLDKMIDQLVNICNHCKFDGYLINIENKVPAEHMDKMKYFVEKLTIEIHSRVKDSLIIWYDSIISPSGELKWQNELNESNKEFFQSCDGIFLNYNWTEDTLKNSLENAGVRKHDVYVGVDVFGRGCFGGGGFNCDLAMEKIRQFGLSAAIFGQGWTHETKQDSESFQEREILFWSKLKPYLYIHVMKFDKKVFKTNFNSGYGKFTFESGHKYENNAMYSLSQQCIQPCSTHALEYEDGYTGTGCLKIKEQNKYHPLFLVQIETYSRFSLFLCTKCGSPYDYNLYVLYESKSDKDQKKHKFILMKDEKMDEKAFEDIGSTIIYNRNQKETDQTKKTQCWSKDSWDIRKFSARPNFNGYVTQIGIEFKSTDCTGYNNELLLGSLTIYT
uniref:Cytosolic endo-beta-N-acetylglucosaminidase n=1 Tax=Cacopsylla melanoneura TaxID=428564 RepID=A0A8D9AZF3_9HEMI